MTLKPAKESQNQSSYHDLRTLKELPPSEFAMIARKLSRTMGRKKPATREVFPEEIESPKSVGKDEHWSKNTAFVHHQIIKIREEDSHLGEDIGEGLSTKDKLAVLHLTSQMDAILSSRPILPSSPLSGKTAIKTCH